MRVSRIVAAIRVVLHLALLFIWTIEKRTAWLTILGVGSYLVAAAAFSTEPRHDNNIGTPIRLNKVFKETHSRRKADALIRDGRVSVNGLVVADMGRRVVPYQDVVELDGELYKGWEVRNGFVVHQDPDVEADTFADQSSTLHEQEEYIKYWKPVGVTSTTDREVPENLLDALESSLFASKSQPASIRHRIFLVGRLDKDSSGLLLLTSDGRLPNAVLRKDFQKPKTYRVTVDKPAREHDLAILRRGLVITTDTVRQGKHRPLRAKTLPCKVERIMVDGNNVDDGDDYYTTRSDRTLQMTLTEGRNRQIRVMLKTLGYHVLELHRTNFLGVDLSGLQGPGDWKRLDRHELDIIRRAMDEASNRNVAAAEGR